MRMPSRGMRIGIIGSGYVGTITGAGLAELGNEVIFVDFDQERVAALNRSESPLFEPGLDELLA
jgi:UDPglucose 6-dehydrogenase